MFNVLLARDTIETATIRVECVDAEEAESLALAIAATSPDAVDWFVADIGEPYVIDVKQVADSSRQGR